MNSTKLLFIQTILDKLFRMKKKDENNNKKVITLNLFSSFEETLNICSFALIMFFWMKFALIMCY